MITGTLPWFWQGVPNKLATEFTDELLIVEDRFRSGLKSFKARFLCISILKTEAFR